MLKQYYQISYQLIKKSYSSNHVLLEKKNWKKSRDNKNFVGTVLMDLSKAFDCIPHDLPAAKLHAYGLSEDAVTFVHLYFQQTFTCSKSTFKTFEKAEKYVQSWQ